METHGVAMGCGYCAPLGLGGNRAASVAVKGLLDGGPPFAKGAVFEGLLTELAEVGHVGG